MIPVKFFKDQQGTAAVELALVLPLLLLIVFGIIEFGILLYDQAIVVAAAREGARWGAVQSIALSHPIICSDPGISTIQGGAPASCSGTGSGNACLVASNYGAQSLITFGAASSTNPSVTVACGPTNPTISVTVQFTYQGLGLGTLSPLGNGSRQITSTSVMYYE